MAKFTVQINQVTTGGPYSYTIWKDGVGLKSVVGSASISAALDGVKADVGGALAGETVTRVAMDVISG